eukprot:2082839-Ditylum_brightwellii.AAC.2
MFWTEVLMEVSVLGIVKVVSARVSIVLLMSAGYLVFRPACSASSYVILMNKLPANGTPTL